MIGPEEEEPAIEGEEEVGDIEAGGEGTDIEAGGRGGQYRGWGGDRRGGGGGGGGDKHINLYFQKFKKIKSILFLNSVISLIFSFQLDTGRSWSDWTQRDAAWYPVATTTPRSASPNFITFWPSRRLEYLLRSEKWPRRQSVPYVLPVN